MKGKTKNKEEEEPSHSQEDRRPGPAHFLEAAYTAHTGREKQEEERKQMNSISCHNLESSCIERISETEKNFIHLETTQTSCEEYR